MWDIESLVPFIIFSVLSLNCILEQKKTSIALL
jgi:hypothetical protein